jgi:DNA-binding IclR family transcriptional regulator
MKFRDGEKPDIARRNEVEGWREELEEVRKREVCVLTEHWRREDNKK